jgi:syntaxin-binding protein 1
MDGALDPTGYRAVTKRRVLVDMLGAIPGEWKIFVLDAVTTRVVSSACGMSELTEAGVSLVENAALTREPQPKSDAVYFLSPTAESVGALIDDFKHAKRPTYRRAFVYFSSSLSPDLLAAIKKCKPLLQALGGLAEVRSIHWSPYDRVGVVNADP